MSSVDAADRWIPVPLTTKAQAAAGVSGGEGFQKIITLKYAPSNPNIVYMGSDTTQVWKSTDGGWHWFPVNTGFTANGARSLAIHPKDPNIVLAAGFLGRKPMGKTRWKHAKQGIYLSTNGGVYWELVHPSQFYMQESTGNLIIFDSRTIKNSAFTAYTGSYYQGLLRTLDGGRTWISTGFDRGHIIDMEESPDSPGTLLIATDQGLFSYDGKRTRPLGKGLPSPPLSIEVSPAAPKRIIAATGKNGVYRSDDAGKTFFKTSKGLPSGIFSSDLSISPVQPDIVLLGTHLSNPKGPYYTRDGGETWHRNQTTEAKNLIKGGGYWFSSPFASHPTDPNIALSVSNGRARVLRTENGGKTWFYSGSGYSGGRIMDIAFTGPNSMVLSLTDHGLWHTSDDGQTFSHIELSAGGKRSSNAIAGNSDTLVASIGSWKKKNLAVSHNSGNSWRIEQMRDTFGYIGIHPQKSYIFYAGNYRSNDKGKSWKRLKHTVLGAAPSNGDIIYGLSKSKKKSTIFRSTDGGNTWKALSMPRKGHITVNAFSISPEDDKIIYVGTARGLLIFDGRKWFKKASAHGLRPDAHGKIYVQAIAIDPLNPNEIYLGRRAPGLGHSNGVFHSKDSGNSWKEYNLNLGSNYTVWSLSTSPTNGSIYMGTSHGLYKLQKN
ncbi:MAG: hypothetical protein ABW116_02085 [Candidatus Sedimenticola sp. 20ELBAFRAG]